MVETEIPKQEKLNNYQECANNAKQFILTGKRLPFTGEVIDTLSDNYLLIIALYSDPVIVEYIDKEFLNVPSDFEPGSKKWQEFAPKRWAVAITNVLAAVGCLVNTEVLTEALLNVSQYMADSKLDDPADAAKILDALGEQGLKEAAKAQKYVSEQQELPFKQSTISASRFQQVKQEKYKSELRKLSTNDLVDILQRAKKRIDLGIATNEDLQNKDVIVEILREKDLEQGKSTNLKPELEEEGDDYDYQYLTDNDKRMAREDVANYSKAETRDYLKDIVDELEKNRQDPNFAYGFENLQYHIYLAKKKGVQIPRYILDY